MLRVSDTTALTLRRLAVAGGALGASVTAHRLGTGEVELTRATPVVWSGLLAVAALVGSRHRWRRRGFAGSFAVMAAAQAAVHAAMSVAPWAFGLAPHHDPRLTLGLAALGAHAVAALVLAGCLTWLEALLERAVTLVRAVRRWLAQRAGRPGVARRTVVGVASLRAVPRGRLVCRGPPALSPR